MNIQIREGRFIIKSVTVKRGNRIILNKMCQRINKQYILITVYLIYLCTIADAMDINRRRNSTCGFKCLYSNECIAEDKECDGSKDCKDGTDETSSCERLRCPQYAFKCDYGACIKASLVCDGKEDCADGSDENNTNCKRFFNNCRMGEFQCNSGECIDSPFVCDGVSDCRDHSDETYATCAHRPCRSRSLFRCNYGACIDSRLKCNGINNCRDGSDEDPIFCSRSPSTTTQPPSTTIMNNYSCRLPSFPDNGRWMVSGDNGNLTPGDAVNNTTSLYVTCNDNYKLKGAAFVTCQDGVWTSPLGYCEVMCPPLNYNTSVSVTCRLENENISCSQPLNQTIAVIICDPKNMTKEDNVNRVCRNGDWEPPLPTCGQFSVNFLVNVNIYARNKKSSNEDLVN